VKLTSDIESPCQNICVLQDGICIGCGRTDDEIVEWYTASDTRKKQIIERIEIEGF
tara:strand:- start:393 stop:560 length:168 start_codon:yes stop_codon:yes gene_type:complete